MCMSEQKSYPPTVSTMGNFFTMAFLLAILITPIARVTVTTIGRPSGIAATARLHKKEETTFLQCFTLIKNCYSLVMDFPLNVILDI